MFFFYGLLNKPAAGQFLASYPKGKVYCVVLFG